MLTLLHYLPYLLLSALGLLALAVMFGDSGARKRTEPQRLRQQHLERPQPATRLNDSGRRRDLSPAAVSLCSFRHSALG